MYRKVSISEHSEFSCSVNIGAFLFFAVKGPYNSVERSVTGVAHAPADHVEVVANFHLDVPAVKRICTVFSFAL